MRPNQIFAVSLPHAGLVDDCHAQVVECVRNKLLTPYGLRTPRTRRSLLCGHYGGDALLK